MNVEEQLREYRTVLDTATEDASTHTDRGIAPVIRMRPVRTLVVATIAVAAAIAVAFAVVGTTDKRSTPPAGVTTTKPTPTNGVARVVRVPNVIGMADSDAVRALRAAGFGAVVQFAPSETVPVHQVIAQSPAAGSSARTGAVVTLEMSSGPASGSPRTVPVTVCPTEQGSTGPNDPHAPSTITIATPPFASPRLAAYSGKRGYLIATAPAGWNCKAIEAGDGGQGVGVTPPGATPRDDWGVGGTVTQPPTDGVFASSIPPCQGCVYDEICGIVPTAAADFPGFTSLPCKRPTGETVTARGNDVYEYDDPAGTIGPDAARSMLRYVRKTAQTDATVVRETCILPASQSNVCDELFAEFFSLQPTPWNQSPLTISPSALGGVKLGMSLDAAEYGAGETFDGHGDGFSYSTAHDRTGLHLFVGFAVNDTKVSCVGAEFWTGPHPTQRVLTPEGFTLGGTVHLLLAIYGNRAKYVPAPKSGMTTNAGYVVQERGGALAFSVHGSNVVEIAGGAASITPNTCTG